MIRPQRSWRDAFTSFAGRKTREAMMAATPPFITEFAEPDRSMIAIGNTWTGSRFDGPFYVTAPREREGPTCSLVFVQSADGNTIASDPSSLGGGQTDKHVVYEGLSRVGADAVLSGAGTVRGEHTILSIWHPALVDLRQSLRLPRHPVQIVATLRGLDIDGSLLFNVPEVSVVVLTVPDGALTMENGVIKRPWVRMITMLGPAHLAQAFCTLGELNIRTVSCIGGRTLATELLDLGLIDDIYLTTAPRPGGEPGTPMYGRGFDASVVVRKRGTAEESGVVFEHFHLQRSVPLT